MPELRIRPSLVVAFMVLLFGTTLGLGGVAYVETNAAIDRLVHDHFDSITRATDSEVARLLSPAPRLLEELAGQARHGMLPVDDPHAVGALLVERARPYEDLAWLGFARPGLWTGARRMPDDSLRLYWATGAVKQWEVPTTGEPVAVDEPDEIYLPDDRPWFQRGLVEPGLLWLEPYSFTDGRVGFSVVNGVDLPDGSRAVLVADYDLEDVSAYLHAVRVGEQGHVGIATQNNMLLGLDPELMPAGEAALAAPVGGEILVETAGVLWRATARAMQLEGNLGWRVVILLPEAELTGVVGDNARRTLIGTLFGLVLAVVLASLLASALSRPIQAMARDLDDISNFAISDTKAPRSFLREVRVMADAVDHMKTGLRSFERYVPIDVVRHLLDAGRRAELGGEVRQLSLLFSDIAGFTTLVESSEPQVVVDALADYFGAMSDAIDATEGVIDKYIGDAVFAFWGAPVPQADHAERAARAALAMRDASRRLLAEFEARGLPPMATRIGVNSGEALVGNIGAPKRFGYTAVGDAVNTAARLEGLNKAYETEIILGEQTQALLPEGTFVLRRLDLVRLKGKELPTRVFELVGVAGQVPEATLADLARYERGLSAYLQQDFEAARAVFEDLPADPAARVMAERCRKLLVDPPPAAWDGVWVLKTK